MKKSYYEFKYLGSCPVCGRSFKQEEASIISQMGDTTHVYAQCGGCESSAMFYVSKNPSGFVTTVGMLTDMTKEDIYRFEKHKPITSDDVLEIHKALEGEK